MLARIRTASFVAALVAVALASASSGQGPVSPPGGTPPGSPPGGTPPGGAPPGLDAAVAVQERYSDQLLDTPGVVGTGVGLRADGSAVIRVYTEKGGSAVLSSSLDGVPVEQVETGMIGIRAPTDRFPRPVPIGVSSGLDGVATGTLGARVTDGTNVYALSNNHVFAGVNTASIGDPIIQPGNVDGGNDPADRIGTLHAYQSINFNAGSTNTMDAAIALTTSANVGTATPSDGYGTPSTVTAQASPGLAVQKYGRTTGFQQGTVAEINVTVDVCYVLLFTFCLQEARFVNQISVSPGAFSAPGDSGSLIVTQNGNQPLALLFAGGDGLTIGTPIDLVLQRFGVTIDGGGPPPNGPARRPHRPLRPRGRRKRLPLLERARLRRRLADHRLPHLPGHEPGRGGLPAERGRLAHELPRHGLDQRPGLLLQGVRRERERRGPALERGAGDPERPRPAGRAAARPRQLQPRRTRTRSPTPGAGRTASSAPPRRA